MENVKIDRCSGTAVYFDGSNPSDKLMMHNCEINGAQNGAVVMEWRLWIWIPNPTRTHSARITAEEFTEEPCTTERFIWMICKVSYRKFYID